MEGEVSGSASAPVGEATEAGEVQDQTVESGEEGASTSADAGQEAAQKKKYKLKVYDEESEYDEDEVVKMAQKAAAADRRFQDAAALEKKVNAYVEKLLEDPTILFKAKNMDPHEWAEQILIEKLKIDSMSPEAKRAWELEQENRRLKETVAEREAREKEEREALAKQQYEQVKSKQAETLDKSISDALQSAGIKRITPSLVRRVAQKMLAYHHAHDGAQLDPAKAVKLALDDRAPEVTEYLEGLTSADFDKLPATFLKALREHFVGQVSSPMGNAKSKAEGSATRAKKAPVSTDDFFKRLDQQFG